MSKSKLFNVDATGKRTLKCVLIGDGGTGKTCMLFRYTTGRFPGDDYIPTIMDNYNANIQIKGETFGLDIWDTAGQEDFESIRQLSYPNASVFIVCYSVNSKASLRNVETVWLPEIFQHCKGVPFVLCGTKSDLHSGTSVKLEDAKYVQEKYKGYATVECSAKSGLNMKVVFDRAIKCVYIGGQKPDTTGRFGKSSCVLL